MARSEGNAAIVEAARDEWEALEGDFNNYGCVALKFDDRWRRGNSTLAVERFYVGHVNGKADICLTKEPQKRHQFVWADLTNESSLDLLRQQGYKLVVRSDGWAKNPNLWIWDKTPAGEVIVMLGLRAMYRSAELWEADIAKQLASERDSEKEALDDLAKKAARLGVTVQDRFGNTLIPTSRQHA